MMSAPRTPSGPSGFSGDCRAFLGRKFVCAGTTAPKASAPTKFYGMLILIRVRSGGRRIGFGDFASRDPKNAMG
jgi:hypothetical protein